MQIFAASTSEHSTSGPAPTHYGKPPKVTHSVYAFMTEITSADTVNESKSNNRAPDDD